MGGSITDTAGDGPAVTAGGDNSYEWFLYTDYTSVYPT